MADSRREMLAKRCQSGSMTVTVDDNESEADASTPTGKERRSSPAASPCLAIIARRPPSYQPPPRRRGWPRQRLGIASTLPDTLPPPGVTPSTPETTSRPSVDLYAGVLIL